MHTTVVDGIRTAYTDEGRGAPLVLVHGFPLSRGAWGAQVEAFKATRRVIAPDLRGLGESEGAGAAPVTMERYADDVHALLVHLGTGPVVLAGHSMGGYIAFAFARRFPSMLRGLVLVSTRAGADSPEAATGRRATAEKVRADGTAVVIDAMAPKMLAAGNPDAAMAARVRALMAPSSPDGVIGALLGMAERPDSSLGLTGIAVPALVISGTSDVLIPHTESERMAAAIPGSTLQLIPNAGHLVALERADTFNAALKEWLTTVP